MHVIAEEHEIHAVQKTAVENCFIRLTSDQAREFIETDRCLASHLLLDEKISIQGARRLINLISERVMPAGEYWPWPRDYYPEPWKSELRSQPDDYRLRFVEAFRRSAETKGFDVTAEFGQQ